MTRHQDVIKPYTESAQHKATQSYLKTRSFLLEKTHKIHNREKNKINNKEIRDSRFKRLRRHIEATSIKLFLKFSGGVWLSDSAIMAYENHRNAAFERLYRCYPVSFIEKPHLENGDKIVMPPSALNRLASLHIEYPMLFELSNTSAGRVTHCGVMEFIADEGLIYLPYWMMENMLLQEGDIVKVKNASLAKGSYAKLQPHTKDFLDISNPKAILETTLRNYSCLTTGDTIMIPYNNKHYFIDIVETKPSAAVSIIETDCEVDFAPPLDYKEPEKPSSSSLSNRTPPEVQEQPAEKIAKFSPFTGSGRRLDGKSSTPLTASPSSPLVELEPHQPNANSGANGSKSSNALPRQQSGKLIFGSNANPSSNGTRKVPTKSSSQEPPQDEEKPKFQVFTGKKYSLRG